MAYLNQKPLIGLEVSRPIWDAILSQAEYLNEHAHSGKGEEFVTEMEKAFAKIQATPETWRRLKPGSPHRRYGPTPTFQYVIVYEIYEDRRGGVLDIYHPRQDDGE